MHSDRSGQKAADELINEIRQNRKESVEMQVGGRGEGWRDGMGMMLGRLPSPDIASEVSTGGSVRH